ncbi:2-polyprenylphenol hydroxylase-like oxidoreductase (plasmid) [Mycolicibacterium chubuense NBB4]|uniref:2-polyprenylphenol hydroxylase-like oxidoreductase n=1 Tax=Mycolicibacterium chubuense (strain NBB4) TaxID=710421 RepID=D2K2E1_MYCCN|nr:2Fe-2S iron-sulfur cluster binding domain-containing protein [Mycolicibacterium chubuense]ACZ56347.1 ethene monooxygenase reductase [Mycolicibacterium chubuense NBB4]AFM20584.1 2-polyprenylphenol hydroxylase-like oxidoreductase [Mycolicibacterium chubuense NBB4]
MGDTVTVQPFGDTFPVESGETVLSAILRNGRFVKYGCKHGGCSTCRAQVVEGEFTQSDGTSFSLSDADRDAGVVLLCSTYADGDLVVDVGETMADLTEDEYNAGQDIVEFVGTVDRIVDYTADIKGIEIALDEPSAISFVPGQYVEVLVPGSDDAWRSFSMANRPSDNSRVHLVVRVIPDGRFTSQIGTTISAGTRLNLRGPLGQFAIRLSHRPIIFIAGGSGIAPVLSMLADLIEQNNQRRTTFLYGARTVADLPMLDELRQLSDELDWFTFIPALSQPDDTPWDGETGLITEVYHRNFPSGHGHEAYLCGPPGMIDAALESLIASGCKERHIFFDRFVPSG